MMIVSCNRCGGGREVHFTEQDTFKWQCPLCNTPQIHEVEEVCPEEIHIEELEDDSSEDYEEDSIEDSYLEEDYDDDEGE